MSVTLEELWYGNLDPLEKFGMLDPNIRRLERQIEKTREGFRNTLGEVYLAQFDQYVELINDYIFHLNKCAFCDGFAIGTKLTAEALLRSDTIE
ncbi:MAG: hypothetical protein IJF34_08750 [Clostridia bacterium]|nr:hypothetical protein [Clostridia bacterium]